MSHVSVRCLLKQAKIENIKVKQNQGDGLVVRLESVEEEESSDPGFNSP
jgi:hypothetical protein